MIDKRTIKKVFFNLLETYKEYESLILTFSLSDESKKDSYLGGIRFIDKNIIISIINPTVEELKEWSQVIKEYKINDIFVDIDKKIPFEYSLLPKNKSEEVKNSSLYKEVEKTLAFAKIIPWSSTELTVKAAIEYLRKDFKSNLSGSEITIIGLGNIGFQLANSLIREGATVNCFTRNYENGLIKSESINLVKSKYTFASFHLHKSLKKAISSSSVLLECSTSINTIKENFITNFHSHKLILDIGKHAFSKEFIKESQSLNLKFRRLDISRTLCEFINSKIPKSPIRENTPSKKIYNKNFNLISGGWKGIPGDVVVDDANNPRFVLGIVNNSFNIDPIYSSFTKWINSL